MVREKQLLDVYRSIHLCLHKHTDTDTRARDCISHDEMKGGKQVVVADNLHFTASSLPRLDNTRWVNWGTQARFKTHLLRMEEYRGGGI